MLQHQLILTAGCTGPQCRLATSLDVGGHGDSTPWREHPGLVPGEVRKHPSWRSGALRSIRSKQLFGVTAVKPAVCLPWSLFKLAGVQFEWPRRHGRSRFLVPTFWVELTQYYLDGSYSPGIMEHHHRHTNDTTPHTATTPRRRYDIGCYDWVITLGYPQFTMLSRPVRMSPFLSSG